MAYRTINGIAVLLAAFIVCAGHMEAADVAASRNPSMNAPTAQAAWPAASFRQNRLPSVANAGRQRFPRRFMQMAPNVQGMPGAPNLGGYGTAGAAYGATIPRVSVAPNGFYGGFNQGAGYYGGNGLRYVTVRTPTVNNQVLASQFFAGALR